MKIKMIFDYTNRAAAEKIIVVSSFASTNPCQGKVLTLASTTKTLYDRSYEMVEAPG